MMRARLPARALRASARDVFHQLVVHGERRPPELVEADAASGAGQQLEDVMDILADGLVGRQQAEVGVETGRAR